VSSRIKNSWTVLHSIETHTGDYCVDIFVREDGSYGYEEFRQDLYDQGRWVGVNHYSQLSFETKMEALNGARVNVSWLNTYLDR